MNHQAPKQLILDSVELLNTTLQPWGLDFVQLDKGVFTTTLQQLQIDQHTLQKIRFDKQVWQRGVAPEACLNIGVLINQSAETNWNNQAININTLEIFSNTEGFDIISPAEFEAYTLSIHSDLVSKTIERGQLNLNTDKLLTEHQVVMCSDHFAHKVNSLLTHLLSDSFQQSNTFCQRQALLDLNHLILAQLDQHKINSQTFIRQARRRVLTKALLYIDENLYHPINLSDVCLAAHTSLRTLDRCFKEKFQASPMAIITILRLHAFRKLLINSPEQKIYYLAGACGFWHMGKLGSDYKAMFGELPSQTKKKI